MDRIETIEAQERVTLQLHPMMWATISFCQVRPVKYRVLGLPPGEVAEIEDSGRGWRLQRHTPKGATEWYGWFDSSEAAREALAADVAAGDIEQWPLEVATLVRGTGWSAWTVQVCADSTRRTAILVNYQLTSRLDVDFCTDDYPTPESRFEKVRRDMANAER